MNKEDYLVQEGACCFQFSSILFNMFRIKCVVAGMKTNVILFMHIDNLQFMVMPIYLNMIQHHG